MSHRLLISILIAFLPLSAQERIPNENLSIIRIYEVRDLVAPEGRSDAEVDQATTELGALLLHAIPEREHCSIERAARGMLVVRGAPDQHAALQGILGDLRGKQQPQYLMRFVIAWMPLGASETENDDLEALFIEDFDPETRFAGGDILSAPSVLTLGYQKVIVQTGSTVRFIESYRLVKKVEGHPQGLAVPQLKEIAEGVRIEAVPIPSMDRKFVTLQIQLKVNDVSRPVPTETTEHGSVHRPVIHTRTMETTVTVPDGGSFVFAKGGMTHTPSGEPRRLCLMVNVKGLE